VADRIVDRRVEGAADRVDLLDSLPGEDVAEQGVDLSEGSAGVVGLGLGAEMGGREVESIEHREQPHAQPFGGVFQQLGLLADGALAEVVEVGLEAPQRVEVLVALGGQNCFCALGLELGLEVLVGLQRIGAPVEQSVQGQVQIPLRIAEPGVLAGFGVLAGTLGGLLRDRLVRPPVHEAAVPDSSTISASTTSSSEALVLLGLSPASLLALCC
jgi:hypothetical protein